MIIKDKKQSNRFHTLKDKFYNMTRLLNSIFFSSNFNFLQIIFINLIIMLPYISIMFKFNDYFPPVISKGTYLFI